MSLAMQLANTIGNGKAKKVEKPSLSVQDDMLIEVGGTAGAKTAGEISQLIQGYRKQVKELEGQIDELCKAIKPIGIELLNQHEESGKYFEKVVIGNVTVYRQNKYKPIDGATYDMLIEALGAVETKALIKETACLEFDSVASMRAFVAECERVGVSVTGRVKEALVPNSEFAQRKCELHSVLDADKRHLLDVLGQGATFAVGNVTSK